MMKKFTTTKLQTVRQKQLGVLIFEIEFNKITENKEYFMPS